MRLLVLPLLVACGSEDRVVIPSTGTSSETSVEVDRYQPDHLTVVRVTLEPEAWDALSWETRLFYELVLGQLCTEEPVPEAFSWYPADVEVDGEVLSEVGVRKKGLVGSMSWTRPSLKVDSDRFVTAQEFAGGTEHFTFNNNNQDRSRIHTCLAYEMFDRAGVVAPRCAFATMEVNGEDLGVYTNVEPLKKAFLRRAFGDDEGQLYEGTASDVRDGWVGTFDVKTDGADRAPLEELAAVLELPDDELMPALDAVLDVEGFVSFWVVEGLIGHWDGYTAATNNFYVYHSATDDKLHFLPWGADAVYQDPDADPLFTEGMVANRLWNHPDGQQMWADEMRRVLDEVWDEAWLHGEVDRMEARIAPHLLDPDQTGQGIEEVRTFVDERRQAVEARLADRPERPAAEGPRYCMEAVGSVEVSFDTEWGSLEADPFAYPTTLVGERNGVPLFDDHLGAIAGVDEAGNQLLAVVAVDATYENLTQVVWMLPDLLEPGSWPVDLATVPGFVITVDLTDPYAEGQMVALLGGELVLDEADYTPGGAIRGSASVILLPNVFE